MLRPFRRASGSGSPRRQGQILAAFAAVYVVWGSTYLAIKVMVESVPPITGAGIRFTLAGALLLVIVTSRHGLAALKVSHAQLRWSVVVGALLVTGGPGLTTLAERDVASGWAALLVASVPVWVVGWKRLLGEATTTGARAAVGLGLGGVTVLVLPSMTSTHGTGAVGVVLMLAVAISYSAGSVMSSRVSLPQNPLVASGLQMFTSGLALWIAGTAIEGPLKPESLTAASGWALAYLIVPGSVLAYTSYLWLLSNVRVDLVATYAYVNPVVALALGALILGEPLPRSVLVAAPLILAAVVILLHPALGTRAPGRQRRRTVPDPASIQRADATQVGGPPFDAEPCG